MNYDMSVAIELPHRPSRPFATAATPGSRLRRTWARTRTNRQHALADWETPLERIDRLHAEFRHPLGRF